MPGTNFTRELTVSADPAACFQALTDVPRLVSWVAIVDNAVEHERLASYSAVLLDRLGPFKMRADLDIKLSEVSEPSHLRVQAAGEDRSVASRLGVDATLRLEEAGPGTRILVKGSYEVVGKVATLGAGTITKKANKILDDFFAHAAQELGGA
jgi:uncharacterized protein